MSDRREVVARAMYDADANHYDIDWFWSEMTQKEREPWFRFADAALAVIDAEPTEAEIAAAMEAFAFEYPLRGLCEDMGWHPSFEAAMYAGLTAFLAARKARP